MYICSILLGYYIEILKNYFIKIGSTWTSAFTSLMVSSIMRILPRIYPFNYPYCYTWEVHPNKEVDAFRWYRQREQVFKEFPIRQSIPCNPNNLIFEHKPTKQWSLPPSAIVWRSREAESYEMPFFFPLGHKKLMGLICALVLPWNLTKSRKTFQVEDFLKVTWGKYQLSREGTTKLLTRTKMKLSTYKHEIRLRQTSLRHLERFKT